MLLLAIFYFYIVKNFPEGCYTTITPIQFFSLIFGANFLDYGLKCLAFFIGMKGKQRNWEME